MKHAITRWKDITGSDPVIIIVNLARSDEFTLQSAKGIESIKDGLFFSGKYDSAMAHSYEKAHVFVFANHKPTEMQDFDEMFSKDRWKVFRINDKYELVREFI